MNKTKGISLLLVGSLLAGTLLITSGCGEKKTAEKEPAGKPTTVASGEKSLKKVRIGNFGTTCEAPIFAAYEQGFFREEGLDAELIKGDHQTLKESLATGKIDATDGVLQQWIKPVEQGLNVKFTGGLHTGCLQVLLPKNSPIKSVKDFKGKTIGVPAIGGGPMNMVARLLYKEGLDTKKDVTWRAFPAAELELALEKGEVDIIALPDPLAQITVDKGKAISFVNMATDPRFKDEYCCLVVINGKVVEEDPQTAAAITRAILKGAKWVSENPEAAAKMEVDKKYVPGDAETNGKVLAGYNYVPSVAGGEKALYTAAKELQGIGILDPATNTEELAKNSFVKLEGVE